MPGPQLVQEYGLFGVMATLVAQLIRSEMLQRKNPISELTNYMRNHGNREDRDHTTLIEQGADLVSKTTDLHRWHDERDEDGVPMWYVSRRDMRDLRDAIKDLASGIGELRGDIRRNGNGRAK